jgi:hypothetical protein
LKVALARGYSLGAASLLTVDAGLAGVSGGLSLITGGIAMDGDSGAVVISSGSSGSNKIAITIPKFTNNQANHFKKLKYSILLLLF